jgi:collagenase-like PrtC family protease
MPDIDISSTLALYVALGITSFKIEGRTRPARYISESIHAVRRGLDAIIERSTEPNLSHYVIHPADRGARK